MRNIKKIVNINCPWNPNSIFHRERQIYFCYNMLIIKVKSREIRFVYKLNAIKKSYPLTSEALLYQINGDIKRGNSINYSRNGCALNIIQFGQIQTRFSKDITHIPYSISVEVSKLFIPKICLKIVFSKYIRIIAGNNIHITNHSKKSILRYSEHSFKGCPWHAVVRKACYFQSIQEAYFARVLEILLRPPGNNFFP